jgi:transcriptional regulator with XRE-family HTH domain
MSMDPQSPTVWRRWLAFELRRLREDTGLLQTEVGKACGWSGARVSYIENAQQKVAEKDLRKLLPLYEVPEPEWPRYLRAAEQSRRQGFWERYGEVHPDLSEYIGLEQGAETIRYVEPAVVPGLLQTRDYTAALLRSDVMPRTDRQIDRLVEMRAARQVAATREEDPVALSSILDEAVLRRAGGGPKAMAAQLDHLVAMAERPNITIRVVPFERGVNVCMLGAVRLLSFAWDSIPDVVFLEHRDRLESIEDEHAVEGHRLAFDHLSKASLDAASSLAMMRDLSEEFSRRA